MLKCFYSFIRKCGQLRRANDSADSSDAEIATCAAGCTTVQPAAQLCSALHNCAAGCTVWINCG